MFVKITFNRNLASRPMYAHYNFDDPWIFPVKMDTAGQIERPVGAYGEVPWFDWFSRAMANEFGYAGLPNAQ